VGAIGVVAALLLPRLEGQFEFGPGGLKGTLNSEVVKDVLSEARQQGLPAEKTLELVEEAAGAPMGSWLPLELAVMAPPLAAVAAPLIGQAARAAREWVEKVRRLGEECTRVVARVAEERGWQLRKEVPFASAGQRESIDFVLNTETGPVLIETSVLNSPESLAAKASVMAAASAGLNARAALVVMPDDVSITASPHPQVELVEIRRLEERLRAL